MNQTLQGILVAALFGALGWFLQGYFKLQNEFYAHRASLGHDGIIQDVAEKYNELKDKIQKLETLVRLNQEKIEFNHERIANRSNENTVNIKTVAKSVDYNIRDLTKRIEYLEENLHTYVQITNILAGKLNLTAMEYKRLGIPKEERQILQSKSTLQIIAEENQEDNE